ncbi:hypothetical protein EV424DRAFT_1349511 [Suillus variegatus]|nr:hypothetical protein EV424DRAFT_1349511 [Suillus variegatus]
MPPQWKNTSQVPARATAAAAIVALAAPVTLAPVTLTPTTLVPDTAAVTSAPTFPAPIAPTAAAVNANILRNPQRHHQLPLRFRENDAGEGESFHLENISGDEEDEVVNSPVCTVRPAAGHSPLQTVMNTTITDPLATGGRAKPPKTSADIHFFFRQDTTTHSNICKACDTSTSTRHAHIFNEHIDIYLEEVEHQHWHILHKSLCLKTFIDEGWTIATMRQRLKDPSCTLDSLGTPPSPSLPGTSLSAPDNVLPAFTLDEMHRHIVKFIIADDQAINIIECPEFRHLIHLLWPSVNETDIFHRTKARELVIDAFHEYFDALKRDLVVGP